MSFVLKSIMQSIVDDKQVEAWSRALAFRWRGNDESWQIFEAYVRDLVAIIDAEGLAARARQDAVTAAADAAVRHMQANPHATATGVRGAILDLLKREPAAPRLAAAAE
jgi:hypothetical protein